MKKIGKIIFIVVLILAGLFLARNFVAKSVIEAAVRPILGIGLNIGKLNLDVGNSLVAINDMKVGNPSGFPDKVMIDIPEIYVDYDMGQILKGNVVLDEMRFDMKEFVVIKNKKGEVNLNSIKMIKDQGAKGEEKPADSKKAPAREIEVKNLSLKVGKVIYKDYSKEGEPSVKEFNINLDENYQNIKSLPAVVSLIIVKTMAKTTVASLTNVDLGGLQDMASQSLKAATETLGQTTDEAKKVIGETTENIKGKLNNLFGK